MNHAQYAGPSILNAGRHCINKRLPYFPKHADPPGFSGKVEAFVRRRAERALPREQFDGSVDYFDLSAWREIHGLLVYSETEGLYEIAYRPPETSVVEVSQGRVVRSRAGRIDPEKVGPALPLFKHLVEYHTHPVADRRLSEGDANALNAFMAAAERSRISSGLPTDFHFVVYTPALGTVDWYKAEALRGSQARNAGVITP